MKLTFSSGWMCAWAALTVLALGSRGWAVPVEIVPATITGALQPQVAINAEGTVFVAFGSGADIYVSVSRDGGAKFDAPRKVGALPNLALGMRRGPRIAVMGNEVTVAANNREDLFAFHSSDEGRTWSAPTKINRVATSAREGLHNVAVGPQGKLYLTWLDLRSEQMEIYGALSLDGGKTWSADELVYHSPGGHVCECCHPSVAFNAKGDLVVMWRNEMSGSRDLWTAVRRAGQKQFEPAVKQGEGTWKLAACPMDGGAVLALNDGNFGSVWRRDQEIFLSLTPGTERKISTGTQPVAVVTRGAVHLWWDDGTELMHATASDSAVPTRFAPGGKFVSAAVSPKDGSVVVVFERTSDGRKSVFADVIR